MSIGYDWSTYCVDIRDVVNRHFVARNSRYIIGGRRTSGWEVFWQPDIMKEYADIVRSVEEGRFFFPPNVNCIRYSIDTKEKYSNAKSPCLLKLRETDNCYKLRFFSVTGFEIVRGCKQVSMRLVIDENSPLFNMVFSKTYGSLLYEDGRGRLHSFWFSNWMNYLMIMNSTIRELIIDICEKYGETKYIYRDIARCIKNDHFCLLAASFRQIDNYFTPDSLVRGITGCDLPFNFNKRNLNYSFFVSEMAKYVDEHSLGKLIDISVNDVLSFIMMPDFLFGSAQERVNRFTSYFYIKRFGETSEVRYLIGDYVRLHFAEGTKLSLKINSLNRLREVCETYEYNKTALLTDETEELIPENSRFVLLKDLPSEFEWITSRKRLYAEGNRQHNCVYSYRERIRRDELAILHWDNGEIQYTIEVRVGNLGFFEIAQMMGPCNINPVPADLEQARKLIHSLSASSNVAKDRAASIVEYISDRIGIPVNFFDD